MTWFLRLFRPPVQSLHSLALLCLVAYLAALARPLAGMNERTSLTPYNAHSRSQGFARTRFDALPYLIPGLTILI